MQWSPFIESLWIARMRTDHAWFTITGADEMTWKRWLWRNCGMKFVAGENLHRLLFFHHENHIEWPRRELGAPAMGGEASNRLIHGAAILTLTVTITIYLLNSYLIRFQKYIKVSFCKNIYYSVGMYRFFFFFLSIILCLVLLLSFFFFYFNLTLSWDEYTVYDCVINLC